MKMYTEHGHSLRVFACLLIGMAGTAQAGVITFDTDAGTIDGVGSGGTFAGVQFFTEMLPRGVTQFRFAGDLVIGDDTTVLGVGARGASLFAGNNVLIGTNVTFDFNAQGSTAGAGGGSGGVSASGGAGGLPGGGGAGGRGGHGGNGSLLGGN
ncbi:MAG: hypothetical protein AB7S57_25390, partial [Acetobacteraceae bacterium]